MDINLAAPGALPARQHIAAITLKNFHGRENVEAQLFRVGATREEMEEARALNLVGPPPAGMPPEILAGATEDAALECVLEAFTSEEAGQMLDYLRDRYADQIESIAICPMDLPAPLGVGPLAKLPESETSGFINFDRAPGYSLPFAFKGYYDLEQA